MTREATEAALLAAAAEANEAIESCHEVVACPKCKAPIGEKCAAMRGLGGGGFMRSEVKAGLKPASVKWIRLGAPTKHPHRERWTQVVASR